MNYNKMIDHTVLKADATKAMVAKIIDEAKSITLLQYVLIQPG